MKTYICAAYAGGQGKTTLAQMVYSALRKRELAYKLVAADFTDGTGHSKIGKFFPSRVLELGIGSSLASSKTENDANAPLRYWDRFGGLLLTGGAVLDMGANVVPQLVQWAHHRRVAYIMQQRNSPEIDLLVITKPETHSIENVATLIEDVVVGGALPVANVIIVQNEVGGTFEGQSMARIQKAATGRNLHFITIPRCSSELWPHLERTFTPVEDALASTENDLAEKFGIEIWSAYAGLMDLRTWADEVYAQLAKVGI
ncbi:hypothetical protein [Xanthobacter tagetidis]|jgi:hypothetical protein|uniref:CobQ/CobB/MinD/ParA nucleotide binding domain-containing protein n=1 Tax=Xanthobacter tagetidis TaxID=60216 RepID=A0A3L7A1Z4_9HYPH|nr:hypothetical protein [Xanthobacter tagetidis]MBB6309491.1 hypothetical protein [Xanthobacter tagetidis]RLP73601.1 hypothetical protein D9R14_20285 [Xanthobacter tagetidis]